MMATIISQSCLICLMLVLAILSTLSSSVSSVRILSLNTSPESYHHQFRHRQSVHPLPFDALSPSSSESMVESLPHQQLSSSSSSSLIEPSSLFIQESYPVNIPLDFSPVTSMNKKQGISSNTNLNGVDTTNGSFDFNARLMDRLLSSLRYVLTNGFFLFISLVSTDQIE